MYTLSWSIVLGLGQYTLNKHVTFFTFLHIIESSVRQHSSCRFSAQHTCGRTVWEMCKKKKKTRCVSSRATLLVKSVGVKIQAVNTWSATWVFLFQCSGKSFILEGGGGGGVVPSLFTVDSGMFRQLGHSLGLLGDWVLTFDSIWWLKCKWMWVDFSWNHFCFDRQSQGGWGSDIAQNLHIIS